MYRTDTAKAVRLKNYKPLTIEVESLDLDFKLDHERNPGDSPLPVYKRKSGIKAKAPLVLDGDGLELGIGCLDGKALASDSYVGNAGSVHSD